MIITPGYPWLLGVKQCHKQRKKTEWTIHTTYKNGDDWWWLGDGKHGIVNGFHPGLILIIIHIGLTTLITIVNHIDNHW